GAKDLVRIAERMTEIGDHAGAAHAETVLGQVELMRAEQDRAAEHLSRAVELFAELPDSAFKAEAHGELARLRLLQYRPKDAIAAARPARELADRLRLTDAAANATISVASARYLSADPGGLAELSGVVEVCRAQRLPALRRAAHNLHVLLLEEGELARAAEAAQESVGAHGGQVSLVVRHDADATWAYYTGDWVGLLHAADGYLDADDAETTEWDLQLRGRRAWIRTLCGEPAGADIERCRDSAARYGFARLRYNACAQGALFHAIRGEDRPAVALLEELASVWRTGPTTLTVEWLSAVMHAAALVPAAADLAAEIVGTIPLRTRWVDAAAAMVAGSWLVAARQYDATRSEGDAGPATARAVRAGT